VSNYEQEWSEYKRRRNLCWLLWLGFPPGCVAIGILLNSVFHKLIFVPFVAIFWVGLSLFARRRLLTWPCPHCGKRFFSGFIGNYFAGQCGHCGLRKFEN
jgi:hypothetical protein